MRSSSSTWIVLPLIVAAAACIIATAAPTTAAAPKLQRYPVELSGVTVTGLSSGGFMAVQMHLIYSSFISGAAIFAGGPYHCAQGSVTTAEMTCMYALPTPPDPAALATITKQRASQGLIDPLNNLPMSFVYLYSGTQDQTVHPPVMLSLYEYYRQVGITGAPQLVFDNTTVSAHTQPTDNPINTESCTVSESPYISDCQYDGAGVGMNQMAGTLGPLNPRANNSSALSGQIISFDQTEFCPGASASGCASISMDTTGYLYVPEACNNTSGAGICTLLLAFHGCEQNYASVGMDYVENAGYNAWADTNKIIVVYPQTVSSFVNPSNPNGCWDWFGYTDSNLYDTNQGAQPMMIRRMITRITGN